MRILAPVILDPDDTGRPLTTDDYAGDPVAWLSHNGPARTVEIARALQQDRHATYKRMRRAGVPCWRDPDDRRQLVWGWP